jgi:3',5'-cyclic AMP phosphodiesterase CpdA
MNHPYRIIHLSDLHCGRERMGIKDVFNKRASGYLNYKFRRKKHFTPGLKQQIPDLLKNQTWDLLLISGDLTNLAYEREFEQARILLEPLLKKSRTLIIPGNHDRYIRGASRKNLINKYFGEFCPFTWQSRKTQPYHIQKLNDQVLLVALDMAVPRPYFSSRGKISSASLQQCLIELNQPEYKKMQKIGMGHYPIWIPGEIHEGYFHQLAGRKAMMQFLQEGDFDLYLHGHIHKSWQFQPLEEHKLISVNSGGCARYSEGEWAGFHRIEIHPDRKIKVENIQVG